MPRYGPGVRLPDTCRPEASGRLLVPGAFATLAEPLLAPPGPGSASPASLAASASPLADAWPADPAGRSGGGAAYRTGTVLGLAPYACYIGFAREGGDGGAGAGGRAVLPVLRPEAIQLPIGVRIGPAGPWPVEPGDPVRVDATGITFGSWLITPARAWRPPRVTPVPGLAPSAALEALATAWPGAAELGTWADAASAAGETPALRLDPTMPSSARRGLHAAAMRVAAGVERPASLVGLGPGLTPSGDDAVAGALLGLRLVRRTSRVGALAAALAPALAATTDLSGSLLLAAAQGYAAPPVVELLTALSAGAPAPVLRRRVAAVLAIGHSSGADLLTGVHAALAVSAEARLFQSTRTKESR